MNAKRDKLGIAISWLCAIGLCLTIAPSNVQAGVASSQSASSASSSPALVRADMRRFLESKAGVPIVAAPFPAFPGQTTFAWLKAQRPDAASPTASRFVFAAQSLQLAQVLLEDKSETRRRQGIMIADASANFIAAQLPEEHWLLARVYEGFLLPNLSLASVEQWQNPSRQRILEAAVSAFRVAGEKDKQKRVLEWLLQIGDKKGSSLELDVNTLDWARGTLAALLVQPENAPRADLERGLALLQAIQSPNMAGFKHFQALLEARMEQTPKTS